MRRLTFAYKVPNSSFQRGKEPINENIYLSAMDSSNIYAREDSCHIRY
jgi:hypothetical protein